MGQKEIEAAKKAAKEREELEKAQNEPVSDAALAAAAAISETPGDEEAAELEAALAGSTEEVLDVNDPRRIAQDRHNAAHDKLFLIAQSYPATTPNEHIIFGFAGHRYELGDLRDLFGLPRR